MASARLSPLTATAYEIDPVTDPRWSRFLARAAGSSIFHSPEWLEALRRTYGYSAAALTTSGPGTELKNGLVFCRVESWLTGRRIVSVPFSDHCVPLVPNDRDLAMIISKLKAECDTRAGEYVELRPVDGRMSARNGLSPSCTYTLHKLDLRPSLDELFRGLHPNCIRRRILRARREDFRYEEVRSDAQVAQFYRLALLTRRRHHIPPQPLAWFRNLIACLRDKVRIGMLFHSGQPAAGVLTLRFQTTITYKYGFSDERFHRFGCMPLLLWKVIQDAKNEGILELDLGRSDQDNQGLILFKDRWGAERAVMTYLRYPNSQPGQRTLLQSPLVRAMFGLTPDHLLKTVGDLFYRHIG